mgnify:CR=1 FL=1|tara:strand:+ start:591 stop:1196 length:606 start_codon:yes stop_codon:yes gene_type:complete
MSINFANNNSLSAITALPTAVSGGALNLISTSTASSSSSLSFTSGIDSTYKEYILKFINIHPQTDGKNLTFQGSTDGGSSYGVTITSTNFVANHNEAGNDTNFYYYTAHDLAQSTNYQVISDYTVNDNDASVCGTLHIFDPSNTTFVKHFIARFHNYYKPTYSNSTYCAGYFNNTSAINALDFKFNSGNIDSGVIKLYGVS